MRDQTTWMWFNHSVVKRSLTLVYDFRIMTGMAEIVPALRDQIEKRRKHLKLSPSQLAEAAGVTLQGLAPLRKGERRAYQDRLTFGVCEALQWTPDSIDRILAGLEPVELTPLDGHDTAVALTELRVALDRLAALDISVKALEHRMTLLERPVLRPSPTKPTPKRRSR